MTELEQAWLVCGDLFCQAVARQAAALQSDFYSELLFCLLGGFGVTYEHGRSAANVVGPLNPFSDYWDENVLLQTLSATLSLGQFLPRRRDGSLRRYRFPRRKARLIVDARKWLQKHRSLTVRLQEIPDSHTRRELLCECPGIGMKTASWLLRNLGWADDVAIIDIHLLRALLKSGRINSDVQLPEDYENAERAFLSWCKELDAPPPAFDLFVWEWQRGTLQESAG